MTVKKILLLAGAALFVLPLTAAAEPSGTESARVDQHVQNDRAAVYCTDDATYAVHCGSIENGASIRVGFEKSIRLLRPGRRVNQVNARRIVNVEELMNSFAGDQRMLKINKAFRAGVKSGAEDVMLRTRDIA